MFKIKEVQDRRMPVFFFFLLLLSVILLEYSTQRYYNDLDHQMSSLYRDRLMPSNYILRLNDQLHKKQRFHNNVAGTVSNKPVVLAGYNDSIASLVSLYEQTFLTKEETRLWSTFNAELSAYNSAEKHLMAGKISVTDYATMNQQFDAAITTLSSLSELQTQEGFKIQTRSKSILDGNFIQHMLELSLLFVIGLIAIQWFRNQRPVLPVTGIAPSAN